MSKSGIEWTNETWNPTNGCSIVSPGCTNCYAMKLAHRLAHNPKIPNSGYRGTTKKTKAGPVWTGLVRMASQDTLLKPLSWKKPRLVFVNSMSDVFHETLLIDDITKIWAVMAVAQQHTFQVLTKRPDIMLAFLDRKAARDEVELAAQAIRPGFKIKKWPLRNVWCGTSVEDQARAEERIPILLKVPAAVRFLSIEPLLGSVKLNLVVRREDRKLLHWVIVGGESGPGARPMHPVWAQSIQDECRSYKWKFFFKQVGSWAWVKDRKASEFLGVLGWRSKSREDFNDQGILRGSKKAGGRKLGGKLYEEMPKTV